MEAASRAGIDVAEQFQKGQLPVSLFVLANGY